MMVDRRTATRLKNKTLVVVRRLCMQVLGKIVFKQIEKVSVLMRQLRAKQARRRSTGTPDVEKGEGNKPGMKTRADDLAKATSTRLNDRQAHSLVAPLLVKQIYQLGDNLIVVATS